MAVMWQAKSIWFFAPLVLFAVASILGGATHRTPPGKYACYGGVVGIVVWVLRFGAVIIEEMRGMR
jgi:hypothetical protein